MKKLLFVLVAFATLSISMFGQSPEGFNYQAVIRNASNEIVANQTVGLRMTLQQGAIGGVAVYSETFSVTTTTNGLVNVQIGNGSVLSGTFANIAWANGPFFIETSVDATGGFNYVVMGTSQLMSVPYALYAKTAGSTQNLQQVLVNGNNANGNNLLNTGTIGVGTATPNTSAKVEIASTTQGFLPPRMTTLQRNDIVTPAAGLTIYNTTSNCLESWDGQQWYGPCSSQAASYPLGSVFCQGIVTKIIPVLNPSTGKFWMDRNLGASQVATSSTDVAAFGDYYQWGRRADGHQCRTSTTTFTLSSTDQPANDMFIKAPNFPGDWRSPQNSNLWQGVNGVNNPCPVGYRLPTEPEINAELSSWISNNRDGAFASPLRLPAAGMRVISNGSNPDFGVSGIYWSSSSVSLYDSVMFFAGQNTAAVTSIQRAHGMSVRCIKN